MVSQFLVVDGPIRFVDIHLDDDISGKRFCSFTARWRGAPRWMLPVSPKCRRIRVHSRGSDLRQQGDCQQTLTVAGQECDFRRPCKGNSGVSTVVDSDNDG